MILILISSVQAIEGRAGECVQEDSEAEHCCGGFYDVFEVPGRFEDVGVWVFEELLMDEVVELGEDVYVVGMGWVVDCDYCGC